jgi:superfamily II DNA or RNA helicase
MSKIFDTVLYDYQKVAAKRIAEQKTLLLADQPGLGKTLEVLGGLELAGLFDKPSKILIITPIINAQTTWKDSIERWVMKNYRVKVIDISRGSSAQKSKKFEPDGIDEPFIQPTIVLANHDALARVPEIAKYAYDAVIIDESHMVLPINDQRKLTNFWRGLAKIQIPAHAIRVAVSGTPDRGKLENRFGTWRFLIPGKCEANRWNWLEKNFHIVEQKVSRTRTVKQTSGLKNAASWAEADVSFMLRRTKAEVAPQLPPKRYVDVEVELTKEQRSAYRLQQEESSKKLFDARIEEKESGEAMVFAVRARQLSSCSWNTTERGYEPVVGGPSSKLDWLLEFFAERGFLEHDPMADNNAKVVIASQFSKVLHWLRAELVNAGISSVAVLDGATSDANRVAIQREFQEGNLRVVLLSGTMGVGINLDRADDLIMFDSPYDPDRIEQIEDRVHRVSSNHKVTIWNVMAADTIDQAIMETVSERYRTTRGLMDGLRGVEFARKVIGIVRKENK